MSTSEKQLSLRFRLDLPNGRPDGDAQLEPDLIRALAAKGAGILESGVREYEPWCAKLLANIGEGIADKVQGHFSELFTASHEELRKRQDAVRPSEQACASGTASAPQTSGDSRRRGTPSAGWRRPRLAVGLAAVSAAVLCLAAIWVWQHREPMQVAAKNAAPDTIAANAADHHPLADSGKLKESVPDEVEALKARAQKGDADARYDLGERYSKGNGVPLDQEKAVAWYRRAAEQGFAKAQAALGYCYSIGKGVPTDYNQAVVWSRKAAEQGNARGQNNLGFYCSKGQGVAQDYAEAVKWYRKAAEQGYALAQNNLGASYASGRGVPQDYAEAVKWYRKAAEQGYTNAQCSLGLCYTRGNGVQQDYAEAVKWYRKAAEQGYAGAQFNLGLSFFEGDGLPRDYVEADKWFNLTLAQAKPGDFIKCNGGAGAGSRVPLVILNGTSIAPGESTWVKTALGSIKVKCLSLDGGSAKVIVEGEGQPRAFNLYSKREALNPFQAAFSSRTSLEKRMTSAQIAEGQRRASAFAANIERGKADAEDTLPQPETGDGKVYVGTGFFVTDDGYFVTCEHVVRGATSFHVRSHSGSLPAKLIKKDRTIDVAVLKVDGVFRALPVAAQPRVKLGEAVFTIGFPNPDFQGVEPKLTRGEISSMAGIQDNPRYYQISVPVQPGNSGGALLDECGNAVGVVTSRLDDVATYQKSGALPQNVNYAVKGGLVYNFLCRVPELAGKLKAAGTARDRQAASVAAERAAVLVVAE